ncbi:C40 family peptidase [Thermoanaerobacter wiegelii]|uniref:NLP/P60 protein n=1 Tax=Thermoanaerobacter wiegelii Rt8.B1 TaxID=697303 RepID=G2MXA8_9THEO|nr:C40 family peptidase [Thermoanaerobacter wiegelii]AEM78395.1 NLP/P60 protein [Thermoanaerobacter wiegelii Rt8.B1]
MDQRIGKMIFGISVFGATLIGSSFLNPAFAEGLGVGKITGNYVNVRTQGSLSGSVIARLNGNDTVTVLDKENGWYKIKLSDGREGWVFGEYLSVRNSSNVSRGDSEKAASVGIVTGSYVNVRSEAGLSGSVVAQLDKNTTVNVLGKQNGWYKIKLSDGREGWIYGEYLAVRSSSSISRGEVDRSLVDKLIDFAKSFVGTPYVYGGSTPKGFDCSGFVQYVFKNVGINLPRTANEQATAGEYVSYNDLQPGDLVFFKTLGSSSINHSGIYIGNGEFIQSSSGRGKVIISPLNEGYYKEHYVTARRIIK